MNNLDKLYFNRIINRFKE